MDHLYFIIEPNLSKLSDEQLHIKSEIVLYVLQSFIRDNDDIEYADRTGLLFLCVLKELQNRGLNPLFVIDNEVRKFLWNI